MILRKQAQQQSFDDALFSHNGLITEGATWNIFFITESNQIITPKLGNILSGITRHLLIEKLDIKQQQINMSDLASFKSAFITNCVVGIKPVSKIDEIAYKAHSSLNTLSEKYNDLYRGAVSII